MQEAENALYSVRTLDDELAQLCKRLEQARCEVYDLAETIRDKREEFDFSPEELDSVESRCDQLYRLKKKYGATVEDCLAYLDKCRAELDAMLTKLGQTEDEFFAQRSHKRGLGKAYTVLTTGDARQIIDALNNY